MYFQFRINVNDYRIIFSFIIHTRIFFFFAVEMKFSIFLFSLDSLTGRKQDVKFVRAFGLCCGKNSLRYITLCLRKKNNHNDPFVQNRAERNPIKPPCIARFVDVESKKKIFTTAAFCDEMRKREASRDTTQ